MRNPNHLRSFPTPSPLEEVSKDENKEFRDQSLKLWNDQSHIVLTLADNPAPTSGIGQKLQPGKYSENPQEIQMHTNFV